MPALPAQESHLPTGRAAMKSHAVANGVMALLLVVLSAWLLANLFALLVRAFS